MEDLAQGLTAECAASALLSPKHSFGKISAKLAALFERTSERPAPARLPAKVERIAIIGGGYAGLAAALELAALGIVCAVFEAAPTLGGRARRIHYHGLDLDNGAHILLGAYRQTLRLMRVAGVPDESLWRLPLRLVIKDRMTFCAARLPAPLHLLVGLLNATGANVRERYAAVAFMTAMRNARFRLATDTTVAALLADHQQGGVLTKYLWEPLCLAALNTPPGEASAQIFLNVLRESLARGVEDSNLLLPRVDLSRLFPEAAAQYIRQRGGEVHQLAPVSRIERDGSRFSVISKGRRDDFDKVICAVGPHQAAELIAPLAELSSALSLIERFSYQPICT
ncbi:MAG: FAD-dependent oxidoreductase, partial [Burkholderiales bacterium]|nr:FAD-dependent oxidoreductase [Burkholderiales bacterium]